MIGSGCNIRTYFCVKEDDIMQYTLFGFGVTLALLFVVESFIVEGRAE